MAERKRACIHSWIRRAQGSWVPSTAKPAKIKAIPGPGKTSITSPTTSSTEPPTRTATRRAPLYSASIHTILIQ